jgi:molybdenum-dependent DNA-binding transcriptional regulator ModE
MHEINSRRLTHLIALAEEGSFARAAERVHLSQPALSRSIQALEDELGMKLFDRAARGVAMTAAGRLLVERARRVLFETRCLFRDVELLKAHELGEVHIGLGPYAAVVLLPDLLVEFSRRFPKIKVSNWAMVTAKRCSPNCAPSRSTFSSWIAACCPRRRTSPCIACRVTKVAGSCGQDIRCCKADPYRWLRCASFHWYR